MRPELCHHLPVFDDVQRAVRCYGRQALEILSGQLVIAGTEATMEALSA